MATPSLELLMKEPRSTQKSPAPICMSGARSSWEAVSPFPVSTKSEMVTPLAVTVTREVEPRLGGSRRLSPRTVSGLAIRMDVDRVSCRLRSQRMVEFAGAWSMTC